MYKNGQGVEKNLKKAVELYEEARRGGDAAAANNLGVMYKNGQGVEKNLKKAVELYEEAGHGGAINLARIHQHGLGGEKNLKKSVEATPGSRSPMQACASCGAGGKCMLCTGCRRTWYCSIPCQRRDWSAHKELCNSFQMGLKLAASSLQQPESSNAVRYFASSTVAPTQSGSSASHSWQRQGSDDLEMAIVASLDEADAHAAPENAQVAEAILRSRCIASAVVLLEFSRNPRSYHQALLECAELKECRDALVASGFKPELPSLAKVFIPPEMFEATMEAVRLGGRQLEARHVLVTPELESTVVQVLRTPGNPEKIRCKSRAIVPLGFAQASVQADQPIVVSRTFIDVKIPSSLRSDERSGVVTASTTDAHAQSGQNPRAA